MHTKLLDNQKTLKSGIMQSDVTITSLCILPAGTHIQCARKSVLWVEVRCQTFRKYIHMLKKQSL